MIMIEGNNQYNAGAQFLAHLTAKEQRLLKTQTDTNSLERKGAQMYWEWETATVVRKKRRLQQKQQQQEQQETTEWINKVWTDLAKQAVEGVLKEQMTKLDAMVWIRHGIKTLERINKEEAATRKTLILENTTLLHSFVWLMRHPVPASVMLDDDLHYFEKLGKIFQAGAAIAPEAFSQISVALVDGLIKCATEDMDNQSWKPKNVFRKLESAGWLELYLAWVAYKSTNICSEKAKTLNLLKSCTGFVRKSFQVGTPCGDAVREIIKRDDCCTLVVPCYGDLIKISESVTCAYKYCDISNSWDKMYHCGKCRKVYYCSKECQVAAWNEHEVICCVPIDKFKTGLDFVHYAMYQKVNGLDLC